MNQLIARAPQILKETFGYEAFRPGQEDILGAVLRGRDVIGALPTGGGKSVCYQLPALLFPHMTIVVSPLIALMKDQTERLRSRGVAASAVHGGMSAGDINSVLFEAHSGRIKLLYVAPERLESVTFRRQLRTIPLSLLAVDEAHCISEWGHDFRPAYQTITSLFDERARVPILALTATATPDVRADIVKSLVLHDPVEIIRGFDRPNLALRVEQTAAKVEFLTRTLRTRPNESAIIYCGSRRRVESIADDLRRRGIAAEGYHAGMPSRDRSDVQDRFLNSSTPVLVATNAFGMGIDKADVRHVFHTDLTLTLEAYYQEAGRAGRDGLHSTCTLVFQSEDRRLMEFYIAGTYPERKQVADVYSYLCDRIQLSIGSSSDTPILADASSVAVALHMPGSTVGGVLNVLERSGVLVRTTPSGAARIQLRTSASRLAEHASSSPPEQRLVAEAIARLLAGRDIGASVDVSLSELLRRNAITPHEFSTTMRSMQFARLIRYIPPQTGGGIMITGQRSAPSDIPVDWNRIHARRAHAIQKLEVMVRYAETRQCKRNFILSYFGDHTASGDCGICSSCLGGDAKRDVSDRHIAIIKSLIHTSWQLQGRFGRHVLVDVVTGTISERVKSNRLDRCTTWGSHRERSRHEVLEALDEALDHAWLIRTADLYPTIGVSEDGAKVGEPLPHRLRYEARQGAGDGSATYGVLLAFRERVAQRDDVVEASIASHDELQRIAEDVPSAIEDLVPGRHGSGLFLARYGRELIQVLNDVKRSEIHAVPKVRVDDDSTMIAALVRPGWTLHQVARSARMTPPAAAQAIQRALEGGLDVDRANLVPNELYTEVLEYMRHHRFAKLRHIREHLEGDVDLAILRVALAFARRDLYSEDT
ncbi:MAG: RecQ family ATP-dependent DNA helicase [Candidatus Kapabacteria bacterium]|nr:RecQ family ATP-dependent DNA helicase [Candidatus Kapabacteria bacterium]